MGLLTRMLAALAEHAAMADYVSLDCRDGKHNACQGCDCVCHGTEAVS